METKFNRTLHVEVFFDGEYVEFAFKAKGKAHPGDPGKLSGPPEDCYPPEPGYVDWHEIKCVKTGLVFTVEEFELLVQLTPNGDHEGYTLEEFEEASLMEELFSEPDYEGRDDFDDRYDDDRYDGLV